MFKKHSIGIYIKSYKGLTSSKPIKNASLPEEVIIPLSQHTGAPARPRIEPGDKVKCGTILAEPAADISSFVHSSISGTVTKIEDFLHPIEGFAPAIVISSDGQDEKETFSGLGGEIEKLSPEKIVSAVRQAGVVGLGGGAFPTDLKLSPPKDKKIDFLILNGVECEPYLTCDHALMLARAEEIIAGAKIIKKVLNADRCYIAVERNKPDAIKLIKKKIKTERAIHLKILAVRYPQGAEKQLIKTVLGREVPLEGLPMDVGVVVNNVGTALAVYEAVVLGKPLYERVVTVTGSIVKDPQNLKVRIGTKFSQLIKECGGLREEPTKIIIGGPMMGLAQYSLDIPVIKGSSGIIFLNKKESILAELNPCIRCARCLDVCPIRLVPAQIALSAQRGRFELAQEWGALDCIECGACEYICGARRPLVQLIRLAKSEIVRKNKH